VGYCEGTIGPTASPNFQVLPDMGGCPEEYEKRPIGQEYGEGDRVSAGRLVFQCKPFPYSGHCSQAGYEPLVDSATPGAWKDAWEVVGHCSGTITPTTSPNFVALPYLGGCPEEWELKPLGFAYEEGDLVAEQGIVFECKR